MLQIITRFLFEGGNEEKDAESEDSYVTQALKKQFTHLNCHLQLMALESTENQKRIGAGNSPRI